MRKLRKNKDLRTVDVASMIGVAESTIRNWENGHTIPRLRADQFKKLIDLYGVSFHELVEAIGASQGAPI